MGVQWGSVYESLDLQGLQPLSISAFSRTSRSSSAVFSVRSFIRGEALPYTLTLISPVHHSATKVSKDQQPQMELPLQGCNIAYIPKDSKKKKHELKNHPARHRPTCSRSSRVRSRLNSG